MPLKMLIPKRLNKSLLSNLVDKNLIVTIPDPKKDPNAIGVNVSFAAETPKEAQDVLLDYIQFVNQWVLSENKKRLSSEY